MKRRGPKVSIDQKARKSGHFRSCINDNHFVVGEYSGTNNGKGLRNGGGGKK